MSHPDEPKPAPPAPAAPSEAAPADPSPAAIATEPVATQAGAFAVAAEPVASETVPTGAPYRVAAAAPDLETLTPELSFGPPPRKARPLIGPALSVFAAMLWTFVVAGQFASSWRLGVQVRSGEATILVAVATLVAFIASMRRSRIAVPPRSTFHLIWRAIGAGVVAFLLFVLSVVAAMAINGGLGSDFLIAFALVLLSLLSAIVGPHLTSPQKPERTQRQRALLVMLWIAGTLLTLVAGVDLGVNG
jgi:hypothetical protein